MYATRSASKAAIVVEPVAQDRAVGLDAELKLLDGLKLTHQGLARLPSEAATHTKLGGPAQAPQHTS
ncbi:MAG: hypothetical protein JKY37_32705 [Nannocystaceae bacterium]|nr:hypothetical protein [Nannocystaceae bacterium]